ncbi:MAG TPA: response regulator [Rhodothermales bacterium]|nr:response regulator [Rhodothermales bacterium]
MQPKKRVLIVEDDNVINEYIAACFESLDWEVVATDEGREALQHLCEAESFDLVLLDVWMPDMNGLEVLRTLRGLGITCPVFIMTAYKDSFDVQGVLEMGATDVLVKPFNTDFLLDRVALLDNQQAQA